MESRPKRTGRPSKLTPDVRQRILSTLMNGSSRKMAAEFAGVSESTFHRWLTNDEPAYREFRQQVVQAEATAQVIVVSNLLARSKHSPRAGLAWLRVMGGPEWRGLCHNCGEPIGDRDVFDRVFFNEDEFDEDGFDEEAADDRPLG